MIVDELSSTEDFTKKLFAERRFLGTSYSRFLGELTFQVRFAGGDVQQMHAASLWNAFKACQGSVSELRERITARYGDEVLRIVERSALPAKDASPEQREAFLAQVGSWPDDEPALLVLQVVVRTILQRVHERWPEEGATLLNEFPGKTANEKATFLMTLAKSLQIRRPDLEGKRSLRYGQAILNLLDCPQLPYSPQVQYAALRRRLHEEVGEHLVINSRTHSTTEVSKSGSVRPSGSRETLQITGRDRPVYLNYLDVAEGTWRFIVSNEVVYTGELQDPTTIESRLRQRLEEVMEEAEHLLLEQSFEVDGAISFGDFKPQERRIAGIAVYTLRFQSEDDLVRALCRFAENRLPYGLEDFRRALSAEIRVK